MIEYDSRIETYQKRRKFLTYELPAWDVKNQRFIPPDMKKPPYQPNNRKKGCAVEEQNIRALGGDVGLYTDFYSLIDRLEQARGDRSEEAVIKVFAAYDLLVIDELGYKSCNKLQASLFFDLIRRRHRLFPTIITT